MMNRFGPIGIFLISILIVSSQPYYDQFTLVDLNNNFNNSSPGNYTNTSSPNGHSPCLPGTYQPSPNQSSCIEASAGFYVPNAGSISQFPCPAGTWQNQTNSTSCLDASAGHYSIGTVNLNLTKISSGNNHGCAIVDNGSVVCWGDPDYGKLGRGNVGGFAADINWTHSFGLGRTVVDIDGGGEHTCAVLDNGSVSCWGLNNHEQLGDGTTYNRVSPRFSSVLPSNVTAVSISAGYSHNCVILNNGDAFCWGDNQNNQLGVSNNTTSGSSYLSFGTNRTVVDISAGYGHTCAILDNGSVYCWGLNNYGQLGDGTTTSRSSINQTSSLGIGRTAVSIHAAVGSTCALLDNGSVSCWGRNDNGRLGDGTYINRNTPTQTESFGVGRTVIELSYNNWHGCAVLDNGSVACWGSNSGQIGVGTYWDPPNYNSPTITNSLGQGRLAVDITTFTANSCALLDDNSMSCWGSNSNGELATGTEYWSLVPTQSNLSILEIISVDQTPCIRGSFQPNTGQSSCNLTSPGHYTDIVGSSHQIQCPSGTYNTNNGSTSLSDCVLSSPGYYASGSLEEGGFESGNTDGFFENSSSTSMSWFFLGTGPDTDYWEVSDYMPISGNYSLMVGNGYSTFSSGSPAAPLPSNSQNTVGVHLNSTVDLMINFSYSVSVEVSWDRLQFCIRNDTAYTHCSDGAGYLWDSQFPGGEGPSDLDNSIWKRSWSGNQSGTFSIDIPSGNNTLIWTYGKDMTQSAFADSVWIDDLVIHYPLGSSSQIECLPGTYQNLSGQSSCIEADPGYFVLNSASTTQSECLQGNYQPLPGQSSCLNASAGYYVPNSGSTNQTACPPGTYNPYIASINSTSCINTSPGYFAANAGSANQTACVPGTYQSNYNQTECIDSSPGFYVSNSSSANQTACSVGTYQPGTNQTNCMDSSPGYYVPNIGSSNQLICNSGTYQPNSGQSSCIDSSPGYYVSTSGQTTQSACLEGTYQPNYNQSGCIDSSPGYYVDNTAMSNQTACPGGTFNPNYGSISSNDCITTSPGYYASSGSGSQNPCQSGTYQPLTGQTNCTSTDPGYYVPGISYVLQLSCNPGTYQPNSGSSDCLIADAGYYVDSYSSDTQTACPSGTFNPVNGSSSYSSCIDTSPGYFTPISGMSEEYPCNPGTYQPLEGQDNCTNSSPGYFVPMNASTTQEPCIAGMYQSNYGRTYCEYPSPGYYVPISSSSNQTRAEPGHYANADDNDTTTSHPCPLGYYQPYSGQSECIEADSGFYVDNNGSTTQIPCIGGTYNPNNGSTSIDSCIESIPGHYSKDGYSIYVPCELGYYQPNSGQSSCIESEPGFYVENNGSIDQIPCIEGTYNPYFSADSQDYCVQSNPGYHVPSPGSANQIPCIKGTYQPNFGESYCISASLGYYVPVEGSISQIAADLDYYVDYTGSFTTSQCPEFYLTLETGSKTIDECLLDTDLDRNPNIFDEDDDNDNILDVNDYCPAGQIGWISGFVNDQDIDGCKDSGEDLDDDNDGRFDENDAFPYDSYEQDDNDLDGQGDNLDIDDDNDGLSDILEYDLGTNQFDSDTDGDGYNDKIDHFPLDGNEWIDTDGDGIGDNSDFMKTISFYQTQEQLMLHLAIIAVLAIVVTRFTRSKSEAFEGNSATSEEE